MKMNEEILELEKSLLALENLQSSFDYIRISIASPNRIKKWCQRRLPNGEIIGEVLRPETVNFRTHQPEVHGLFCEKIFGPIKNWKCRCGKYNGFIIEKVCEDCHVEITEARVRRYRMGYIDLSCPIAHLWYFKGVPNYLSIILQSLYKNIKTSHIENIVYFVSEKEKNPLVENFTSLSENELKAYGSHSEFAKRRGAEILKAALDSLNLNELIQNFRSLVYGHTLKHYKRVHISDKTTIRRIRILESFVATNTNPSWMILTVLPILPPNLRPLLELENGRLVAADVNEFYRLIITRNQRLFDFIYNYVAPDLISIQGRKLLQEGIDSLIDNARIAKARKLMLNNKALKSLTEILEGKQGRFRQSLLGKRVDYSGRSVIIVGPTLRLNQCGLPYDMAMELFQPYLINELLKTKIHAPSHNTKLASIIIKKNKPFVWSMLRSLTMKYCILLNRAPTLHRFGIQAFDPLIVLGQAIHLHPLVCTGFNADFDGDQMAVHLPLYESSQLEARTMMRPSYNILSPANGEVILKPTQDMVIGNYYLTFMTSKKNIQTKGWFANEQQALLAFYQKKIMIHTPILVRYLTNRFFIKIIEDKIIFLDTITKFVNNENEIFLYKIFAISKKIEKYYLITNLGIFCVQKVKENTYEFLEIFLETTPGRLIFSVNLKNLIQS